MFEIHNLNAGKHIGEDMMRQKSFEEQPMKDVDNDSNTRNVTFNHTTNVMRNCQTT